MRQIHASDLQLSPHSPLIESDRKQCPTCHKYRNFFCCDCVLKLTPGVPLLQLPVQIDIIIHGESNKKATGTHAALIAPDQVTLIRDENGSYHHRRQDPDDLPIPDYDPETTVVLFPESSDTDIVGECPGFTKVVVLEGSWRKARALAKHVKLAHLRRVQLPRDVRTVFWRRGEGTFRGAVEEGVCTIEAVYYLCRALQPAVCCDDLLWYFVYIRGVVEQRGTVRAWQQMKKNEVECGVLTVGMDADCDQDEQHDADGTDGV